MRNIKSPDEKSDETERSDKQLKSNKPNVRSISSNNTLTELFVDSVQRPRIDLVIAIDVSGSMALPFGEDSVTSDDTGEFSTVAYELSKIEWISEALSNIVSHLREESRLGIVCFNNEAESLYRLSETSSYDVEELTSTIMRYDVYGGANLCGGIEKAAEVIGGKGDGDRSKHVLFVSDSLPSASPKQSPFVKCLHDVTDQGIDVTFVGLDSTPSEQFSNALSQIESVTQYYINSPEELLRA